jgi:hypothetical protein
MAPQVPQYGYIGNQMKTTIELPDDLFIAAKKRAVELPARSAPSSSVDCGTSSRTRRRTLPEESAGSGG